MNKRRFVHRTIKNGQVKIFGKVFRPELDISQFDGIRAIFGLYWRTATEWEQGFIHLWGSEEDDKFSTDTSPGTFVSDGFYKWEWWNQAGYR